MISLALTILLTVVLFLGFKEFTKRNINTHQAITFNYLTASILGFLIYNNPIPISEVLSSEWLYPTITLGIFFVIMFNVMADTTQKLGISIASMASKISLVIPVFAALLLQENTNFSWINGFGILFALIAVYFTFKKEEKLKHPITIAIILFLGAGILDMSLNYIQEVYLQTQSDFSKFIIVIFFIAFSVGLVKIIFDSRKIELKNVIAGILLGIPNYFSIYFVLGALEELGGIIVFSVLNIGVVLLSSIISFILYKVHLIRLNWIGITLSCVSIILILVF
ncbi:MAG: DMT family transporter [Bacteroidota bacterium]|nr:DMT family transporter [Bacteroidota bacterium]